MTVIFRVKIILLKENNMYDNIVDFLLYYNNQWEIKLLFLILMVPYFKDIMTLKQIKEKDNSLVKMELYLKVPSLMVKNIKVNIFIYQLAK